MTTYHHHFEEVRRPARRSGECPVCGKRRNRQTQFTQTINPWNLNEHGKPKTPAEIGAELNAQVAAWQPDFTCASHEGES